MSADRSERLREAYDQVSRGDVDGFLTVMHEDAVWTEQVLPDQRVYHGHAGVRQWIADVTEAFTWGTFELIDLEQRGDDVVSQVRVTTHGSTSGVEVDATVFHVIRYRGDRIARITALFDRDEALRAAGLG